METLYALATRDLVENRKKITYMYRVVPERYDDSGWRMYSGDEPADYEYNPGNLIWCSLESIAEFDDTFIPFVDDPIETLLEWNSDLDEFVEEDY